MVCIIVARTGAVGHARFLCVGARRHSSHGRRSGCAFFIGNRVSQRHRLLWFPVSTSLLRPSENERVTTGKNYAVTV
jgi:hypothetical protein